MRIPTTVLGLASLAMAAAPLEWQSRSIYQVMTDRFAVSDGGTTASCDLFKYCGGTWQGIIKKLDYIQGMGFTAVQISPVVKNIEDDTAYGESYHGYWPQDMYTLNQHFGTADDLKALSKALHDRGMFLMVDVVINDMAVATVKPILANNVSTIDWSKLKPFNDQKYYHDYCNITNWEDPQNYQNCWFGVETVALPDLKSEDSTVVNMIGTWIKQLVTNYTIDGLRIDATKHMNDAYLKSFGTNAGVFTIGEVYSENVGDVCRYEGLVDGLPNYPMYFAAKNAFLAGNMKGLMTTHDSIVQGCKNLTYLAPFSENHDLPRVASLVSDEQLAANLLVYTLISDGMPMIYQGQEQHATGNYSPYNRGALWTVGYDQGSAFYNLTASVNKLRNHAISIDSRYVTELSKTVYQDDSTIALRKGPDGVQILSVLSNQGAQMKDYTLDVATGFPEGQKLIDVTNCQVQNAVAGGNITVKMTKGQPRVFFPEFQMNGSGICGYPAKKSNSTSSKKNAAEAVQSNFLSVVIGSLFALSILLL